MIAMTKARLDVVPLTQHIGAEFAGWTCTTSPTTRPSGRSIGPGSITS